MSRQHAENNKGILWDNRGEFLVWDSKAEKEDLKNLMMMMMMMMNCFCGMVDRRKVLSFISSRDYCQRYSPSRSPDTPRAGFEPARNLSSGLVERSCSVVITTTLRRHINIKNKQKEMITNGIISAIILKQTIWNLEYLTRNVYNAPEICMVEIVISVISNFSTHYSRRNINLCFIFPSSLMVELCKTI